MTRVCESWAKVSKIYFGRGSLSLLYKGTWKEIRESLVSTVKELGFGYVYSDFDWYRYSKDFQWKDGSSWTIDFSLIRGREDFVDGTVEALVRLKIYMIKPVSSDFYVVFHPRELKVSSSVDAVDFIKSTLIRLINMIEDLGQMGGWMSLMDNNLVIILHDGIDIREVEFVFGHSKLPHYFVVAYYVDGPLVFMDYRVASKEKSYFDTLVETIIDEYWEELISGGDKR